MNIKLEKVQIKDKEILYRLLEYSLFEESLNDLNEMNDEGLYEYRYFESYFIDEDRDAYFIKEAETDKLVGFAMINTYMQIFKSGHSIAEFMIIPKYRNKHIGKKVAFELFGKYKGNWEISPSHDSVSAFFFWNKVINEYTKDTYVFEKGLFRFNNE